MTKGQKSGIVVCTLNWRKRPVFAEDFVHEISTDTGFFSEKGGHSQFARNAINGRKAKTRSDIGAIGGTLRNHNLFCALAIVVMANIFTACDSEVPVAKPIERTIYVCADKSEKAAASECPPMAPVVETSIEFVCRGGTVVKTVEECPIWTLSCPERVPHRTKVSDGTTAGVRTITPATRVVLTTRRPAHARRCAPLARP